ncbi:MULTISPECIES: carbohydrate ABC transporter permease [Gracilibacillus]|uniref:carbohydrate ABC transporter permease n=1 Tax=Gracilibacillus TaxID=74385 RepID=UPI000826C040|nr:MULTISPECIES: sugar ABC transporter permease [Gracilibacillus]
MNAVTKRFNSFKHKKLYTSNNFKSLLFLSPSIIIILIFFVGPIFVSIFYAFTDFKLTGPTSLNYNFVGFENFIRMFTDPRFYTAAINTLLFLFGSLIAAQGLGFFIAYLIRGKNIHIRRFVGTSVLLGWVAPEIVAAYAMMAFLDEQGMFNTILSSVGLPEVTWLFSYPMLSIIIANVWRGTAFSMMNFQAGFDGIPHDIEEAASIDGANKAKVLVSIIIPMLKNQIVTLTILNTLTTMGVFGLIYALTGGGPGLETTTLSIFMYEQAFTGSDLAYGSAIALVILLIGIFMSLGYLKVTKSQL